MTEPDPSWPVPLAPGDQRRFLSIMERLSVPKSRIVVKVDAPGWVDLDFGIEHNASARINCTPEDAERVAAALCAAARVAREGASL